MVIRSDEVVSYNVVNYALGKIFLLGSLSQSIQHPFPPLAHPLQVSRLPVLHLRHHVHILKVYLVLHQKGQSLHPGHHHRHFQRLHALHHQLRKGPVGIYQLQKCIVQVRLNISLVFVKLRKVPVEPLHLILCPYLEGQTGEALYLVLAKNLNKLLTVVKVDLIGKLQVQFAQLSARPSNLLQQLKILLSEPLEG